MKTKALGVVVVRVQVPELHDGHRYLLDAVTTIHEDVLVVVGESEVRLSTTDPLTYEMRRDMVLAAYPNVMIARLRDTPSDALWSEYLDELIQHAQSEGGPEPVLYGGRDSFLKHYSGHHRIFELPPAGNASGTAERAAVLITNTTDFRRGMIWAAKSKYPTSYQCVDAAVVRMNAEGIIEVLLGQKRRDEKKWRFVGGFVNPTDPSLEAAAYREVSEETKLEVGAAHYLGSVRVDDYRYRSGSDKLLSAFFLVQYVFGAPSAGDDLDDVRWFKYGDVKANLVPEHQPFYDLLHHHYHSEV